MREKEATRQLRALDWEEKWLGPLKEINDLH